MWKSFQGHFDNTLLLIENVFFFSFFFFFRGESRRDVRCLVSSIRILKSIATLKTHSDCSDILWSVRFDKMIPSTYYDTLNPLDSFLLQSFTFATQILLANVSKDGKLFERINEEVKLVPLLTSLISDPPFNLPTQSVQVVFAMMTHMVTIPGAFGDRNYREINDLQVRTICTHLLDSTPNASGLYAALSARDHMKHLEHTFVPPNMLGGTDLEQTCSSLAGVWHFALVESRSLRNIGKTYIGVFKISASPSDDEETNEEFEVEFAGEGFDSFGPSHGQSSSFYIDGSIGIDGMVQFTIARGTESMLQFSGDSSYPGMVGLFGSPSSGRTGFDDDDDDDNDEEDHDEGLFDGIGVFIAWKDDRSSPESDDDLLSTMEEEISDFLKKCKKLEDADDDSIFLHTEEQIDEQDALQAVLKNMVQKLWLCSYKFMAAPLLGGLEQEISQMDVPPSGPFKRTKSPLVRGAMESEATFKRRSDLFERIFGFVQSLRLVALQMLPLEGDAAVLDRHIKNPNDKKQEALAKQVVSKWANRLLTSPLAVGDEFLDAKALLTSMRTLIGPTKQTDEKGSKKKSTNIRKTSSRQEEMDQNTSSKVGTTVVVVAAATAAVVAVTAIGAYVLSNWFSPKPKTMRKK
jgi:hypothetical protein